MDKKYIALDIGNVLCHQNLNIFMETWENENVGNMSSAYKFLVKCQKNHDIGFTTMKDELTNYNIDDKMIDPLLEAWNKTIYPNEDIIKFFNKKIDKYNLSVALLSNMGFEHTKLIKDILNIDGFHGKVIKHMSCFVGARKPSLLFYQSFLMKFPEFKDCFYIDDIEENLEISKTLGFKPYKFSLETCQNLDDQLKNIDYILSY